MNDMRDPDNHTSNILKIAIFYGVAAIFFGVMVALPALIWME